MRMETMVNTYRLVFSLPYHGDGKGGGVVGDQGEEDTGTAGGTDGQTHLHLTTYTHTHTRTLYIYPDTHNIYYTYCVPRYTAYIIYTKISSIYIIHIQIHIIYTPIHTINIIYIPRCTYTLIIYTKIPTIYNIYTNAQ